MMFLDATDFVIMITVIFVGLIILLAIVAFIIALVKRTKKMQLSKNVKIDKNALENNELISLFGEDNIVNVEWEMSRVTVEVKNIDLVDTTGLQEKGASGILLVGNKVKCNFKENAENIAKYLKGNE